MHHQAQQAQVCQHGMQLVSRKVEVKVAAALEGLPLPIPEAHRLVAKVLKVRVAQQQIGLACQGAELRHRLCLLLPIPLQLLQALRLLSSSQVLRLRLQRQVSRHDGQIHNRLQSSQIPALLRLRGRLMLAQALEKARVCTTWSLSILPSLLDVSPQDCL